MDAVLAIVQLGLLVICVVSGLIGLVLLTIDRKRPKHKTTDCGRCLAWYPMALDYGRCAYTDRVCRAGKRACDWERRGK